MDRELNHIWSLSKEENTITYPHNGETVIYRKQINSDTNIPELYEFRLDQTTGRKTGRNLSPQEMSIEQFDQMKDFLDKDTKRWFRNEKNQTYLNVCFDTLAETDLSCLPSPETELIKKYDRMMEEERKIAEVNNPLHRTMENAKQIMDECLTKKQKERFTKTYMDGMSSYEIADEEKVDHKSILESILAANMKINKKIKQLFKESQKTPS